MVDAERFSILDHPTSIGETTTVANFTLQQNYPNPFNSMTRIQYSLPEESHVQIKVFDLRGHEIGLLVDERQRAALHAINFAAGQLPSGVYFYTLRAGGFSATKKMVLLR